MIILDTETCGLHGVPVLLQYAVDDGEVQLYELWKEPIQQTLDLLKYICEHQGGVLGFNLVFDWFQLSKFYCMLSEYVKRHPDNNFILPIDDILGIAKCEKDSRDGPCLKPVTALDLFLHARKGKYQSTLDRKDIRIKKVPAALAHKLADELNSRIKINPLYFARRKSQLNNPWQVLDIIDKESDRLVKGFNDIVLKFSPSSALKAIVSDAFNIPTTKFKDIGVHENLYPLEVGWAPFAQAVEDVDGANHISDLFHSWPAKVKYHIDHWSRNQEAREYAANDVIYLQRLYDYFDKPAFGDDDSILACQVAAVRWHGYAVDIPAMQQLLEETKAKIAAAPIAPSRVKEWIFPELNELEKAGIGYSTKKVVLEGMVKWRLGCDKCNHEGCNNCKHPAAIKAQGVLDARTAKKEAEIYEKILQAGRFHASFKVIGTLSSRMAGADGLNPQGIRGAKRVRKCFTLADRGYRLCGGDLEAFEVVIALAVYKDENLEEDLNQLGLCPDCLGKGTKFCLACKGTGQTKKKIHGLFGETIYGLTYDEIVATKGQEEDLYYRSKRGVFSQMYFGNAHTLVEKLGIDEETATEGEIKWHTRYAGIGEAQQRIKDMFCSMVQPDGLGTKVIWKEPADYIESLLGFRRYYTLENNLTRVLFELAEKPPKDWTNLKIRVRRRDRDQTVCGALRSALFGAAFQIQGQNLRSAGNHEIQCTGAQITKRIQCSVWEMQPSGIHEFVVLPSNIHDEIMCPTKDGEEDRLEAIVRAAVDSFKPIVPMISIDWSNNLKTWADK